MKRLLNIVILLLGVSSTCVLHAQNVENTKFAIKAHANVGLGNAVKTESPIQEMMSKSSGNDFGLDFGWTFWQKHNHSFEVNLGVAYNPAVLKLSVNSLEYNYSASAEADMDGNAYKRYYELSDFRQEISTGRVIVPVYLTYKYRFTDWLGLHVDAGVNLGFKTTSKISSMSGSGYSYGIYPEYGDLKIDESYLNNFGNETYNDAMCAEPKSKGVSASIIAGIGAEFKICGPLSADLSFRYNAGLTNLYEATSPNNGINAENAPVTYTVKDGTTIKPFTDYLLKSKLSQCSLNISLIYRF